MVCILSGCGDTILQGARLSMALAPESGYCDPGSKLCGGIVHASKFMMVTVCVCIRVIYHGESK